ncbi:hypothetical protein HZA87_04465 [Candidatus Uhrbacteria bacterium]|nr:hypothetical protein [Candidatus Uhrbacteria bacterium]
MPNIEYPYMPAGRFLKYAAVDDPFMVEASKAREECAGDPLYPVGIVMVKNGQVVARAGNGFNRGPGKVHVCPRIVLDCPSGTGYELCDLHDAPGHSERMVLQAAWEAGVDPAGADVYMFGHWWACEPCWTALIEAGVRDLYVVDDAHERFSRDKVYGETLTPSVRTVSLVGFDGEILEAVCGQLGELGLEQVDQDADVRCVMEGDGVRCFLKDEIEPVYKVESGDHLARQLRNVLRQL